MVEAGTPFLGQMQADGIEKAFFSVGQLFNDLPKQEYVLEAVTEMGFQVFLSTVSGNRYGLEHPLDLQSLWWHSPPTLAASTTATPEVTTSKPTCDKSETSSRRGCFNCSKTNEK
eukprot:TRINITY_DN32867_c0_g1_i1.p1 TRINITY_DN32867_c0_g1~~TRINITY_DN32867_c0_g1_i1.p1  ORF type:complete len:126 (+),score=42.17 TRINITY_DN32867_c0_g1_i1:34-378(+)